MAYRFTDTVKWNDSWFSELKPLSKLLFLYLCDQCDIAGFLELNVKKISFDLGTGKQEVERSIQEVSHKLIYSKDNRFIFIRKFLQHQRNLPLKKTNKAHLAIIGLLTSNLSRFGFDSIEQFIEGQSNGVYVVIDNHKTESTEDIGVDFEHFFNEYHRITLLKKSDKDSAFKKWKALSKKEQSMALDKISSYYNSLNDKKYCKKARTYLNDKNFNDEFTSVNFREKEIEFNGRKLQQISDE